MHAAAARRQNFQTERRAAGAAAALFRHVARMRRAAVAEIFDRRHGTADRHTEGADEPQHDKADV